MVEQVLTDERWGIFHGVIVAPPGPDQSHRFAHREQIADLYERGVVLSVPGAEMHEPGDDPPAGMAEEAAHNPVQADLRRAWQRLPIPLNPACIPTPRAELGRSADVAGRQLIAERLPPLGRVSPPPDDCYFFLCLGGSVAT
ncbi:hypothetical protein ABT214_02575 [Micromonospora purpureochromogenes]|uniref:hypothetical protein n=1 Tax=Micromonospora purpureochromogenes TaxID=47872 RepID=UPI003321E472